jgi:hypothetical protein
LEAVAEFEEGEALDAGELAGGDAEDGGDLVAGGGLGDEAGGAQEAQPVDGIAPGEIEGGLEEGFFEGVEIEVVERWGGHGG